MSSIEKIKNLVKEKEQLELQIANLESLRTDCNQEIEGAITSDTRRQLRARIKKYSTEINEIYDDIDETEEKINELELEVQKEIKIDNLEVKKEDLSLNDQLDNPKNQQQLKIKQYLPCLDFEEALDTFKQIQSQFKKAGDVALFFMEESSIKRGDLFLKRLENELKPKPCYRNHFRYCYTTYTLGNLEAVIQGIATFFTLKKEEVTIELIIQKISDSLQRNSVLFIEINCDINHESDVDKLIPWFVDQFWKPLRNEVKKINKKEKYTGIKIVAIISSNLKINERLLTENLSCYQNNDCSCFERDKLVKIPLENWAEDDIKEWLSEYSHPSLTEEFINKKAYRLFNESLNGVPRLVCDALEEQWQTLIYPTTSD